MTGRRTLPRKRAPARFYVQAITDRSATLGYGVYDSVGGMVSRHAEYWIAEHGDAGARTLAERDCKARNAPPAPPPLSWRVLIRRAGAPDTISPAVAGRDATDALHGLECLGWIAPDATRSTLQVMRDGVWQWAY
jgi:hypothetical protein